MHIELTKPMEVLSSWLRPPQSHAPCFMRPIRCSIWTTSVYHLQVMLKEQWFFFIEMRYICYSKNIMSTFWLLGSTVVWPHHLFGRTVHLASPFVLPHLSFYLTVHFASPFVWDFRLSLHLLELSFCFASPFDLLYHSFGHLFGLALSQRDFKQTFNQISILGNVSTV